MFIKQVLFEGFRSYRDQCVIEEFHPGVNLIGELKSFVSKAIFSRDPLASQSFVNEMCSFLLKKLIVGNPCSPCRSGTEWIWKVQFTLRYARLLDRIILHVRASNSLIVPAFAHEWWW